jgi:nitrite reductase/ring-hydroxylating ferredoxin subunit
MANTLRIKLGSLDNLPEGGKRSIPAADTNVLVCRVNGILYAVEDLCSHSNSALCPGRLAGHIITCPLHAAQFDVRDGAHQGPPAYMGIRKFSIEETHQGAVLEVTPRSQPPLGHADDAPMTSRNKAI